MNSDNQDPICLFIWVRRVIRRISAVRVFLATFYRLKLWDPQIKIYIFKNQLGGISHETLTPRIQWLTRLCWPLELITDRWKSTLSKNQRGKWKVYPRSVDDSNSKRLKVSTSTLYSDHQHQYYFYNIYYYWLKKSVEFIPDYK